MINQDSVIARCSKPSKSKREGARSRYAHTVLAGAVSLSTLLMGGCSSETYSENSALIADKTTNDDIAKDAENIKDSITNSYARLASKRTDVCPKLIAEEQGNQVVERVAEVMVNDYCDYFLYLREGQYISIKTNNRQLEALLIVPTLHNFANGGYKVSSYDKHVIRLSYNGATHRPQNLSYDIELTISDKKTPSFSLM